MSFKDIVKKANAVVQDRPHGRNKNQDKLDSISSMAGSDTPFSDVQSVIDGNASSRRQRKSKGFCIDEAVIPGNQGVTPDQPTVAVSISPSSWGEGANQITAPNVQTVGTVYLPVFKYNNNRSRLTLQNVGTTNIFVVYGTFNGAQIDTASKYHYKIAAGQTFVDESWQGAVMIASDSAGGACSVAEFSRSNNVSQ